MLSGCLGTQYLQGNQKLLYKQKISGTRSTGLTEWSNLYVQKTNRKFLGLPAHLLVTMYYTGQKKYRQQKFIDKKAQVEKKFDARIARTTDQRKIGNIQYHKQQKVEELNNKIESGNNFMQWGEPLTVFDSAQTLQTAQRMTDYLISQGFFLGKVIPEVTPEGKLVNINYRVTPGPAYLNDTIFYQIADTAVAKIILDNRSRSLIKVGDRYQQDLLSKERDRIDLLLKNRGYYDFSREYIDFEVDTSYRPRQIATLMNVRNPPRKNEHRVFRIDSISFTTDASLNTRQAVSGQRTSKVFRNITFNYYRDEFSRKILSQRVSLEKDSLFSREKTFFTQRQLANLDIFKFVNISYDTGQHKFTANIFTSPLDRYSWSNEFGVTVTQGFPGPYVTTSLKKRNLFGGLEIFEINGRFGFEGVAAATQLGSFYRSVEAGANVSLTFPQILFPFSRDAQYRIAKYSPRTRLLAGITYTDRPEYRREITSIAGTFFWENHRSSQYQFTITSLNIIQSKQDSAFNALLVDLQSQGNNLINSFKPSFVTSMIFSFTYNPNNYGNSSRSSFFLRTQIESGGTLLNLYEPAILEQNGLETYKYIRLSADLRRLKILNKNTVLASRLNAGLAYSYGKNTALPYEKYFFVGGSNSVRAWRPRRLGVGSRPPPLTTDPSADGLFDYRFEQPGDILLEASVELRKKLFGFVHGAFFVDVGNVWTVREQNYVPTENAASWTGATKFKLSDFASQLGVGTGLGVRFDFSFLVFRFDVGVKVYDPAREQGDRFVLNRAKAFGDFTDREPMIFNIGVGYPF